MRIKCLHGYFKFYETGAGQISHFMSRYGFSIVPKDDYFTFEALESAPEHSILTNPYLDAVATATFEGKPWEVMEENGLVYNFSTGLVVPILTITKVVEIQRAANYFLSNGLILPGSLTVEGSRVKDYSAWFSHETYKFRYSEVTYV